MSEPGNRVVVLSEENWKAIDLFLSMIAMGSDIRTAKIEVVQEVLTSFREHTVISKPTEDLLKSAREMQETLDRLSEVQEEHPYRDTSEWAAVYGAYVVHLCQRWEDSQFTSFPRPSPENYRHWVHAAESFADTIERLRHECVVDSSTSDGDPDADR